MAFMKWTSKLSVKIKKIDEQHKNLIEMINKAYSLKEKDFEKKEEIIDELVEFARVHFSTEENYFEKYDYPGKEEHIMEHEKLLSKVLGFKNKFENGKVDLKELLVFLKDWIENHLKKMDRKYVDFFQEIGIK